VSARRVACPYCNGRNTRDTGDEPHRWRCDDCQTLIREADMPAERDDGRIRSPDDVGRRVAASRERASVDKRLSELDRRVHALYCDVVEENSSVEVMVADTYTAEKLGLDEKGRTSIRRSRERLTTLRYFDRLEADRVTRYGLKAVIETRKAAKQRPATLLTLRNPPPMPECELCGAEIPDGLRVWRRYCGDRCRQAAHRARVEVLA